MRRRIPVGPLVAAIGAVLLIVSLFLDWYEDTTGFTVFEALDLALVALAVLVLVSIADELGAPVRLPARRAPVFGALALAIVLTQLVNDPPLVLGDGGPGHAVGIWLALGGAALMTAGALLAGTRISLAVDVSRRERPAADTAPVRSEPRPADDRERP